MAVDDLAAAVTAACEDAKKAEAAEVLDDVHEYGGRARTTLETIERSGMQAAVRETIEQAIRHAANAEHAVSAIGGQHDARRVRELLAELGEALSA